MNIRLHSMTLLILLVAVCWPHQAFGAYRCLNKNATLYRSALYARPSKYELRLNDNECMASVVLGDWCHWEPVDTGHGVTTCQKGLNIRWRRRQCNCPPPKPLYSHKTWCMPPWNTSSVATLLNATLTRLEALKPAVWNDAKLWRLNRPFSRPGSLTNSLLACMRMDDSDCFFHTGAMYTGTVHHVRSGKPCLHWSSFQTELVSMGLTKSKLRLFLATNPRNYCRNPLSELEHTMFANSRLKPWCFVNKISYEMRMLWDYCEIKRCGSSHYHGIVVFDPNRFNHIRFRGMTKSTTHSPTNTINPDPSGDMNAEACFETCRFRCEKFALMNLRRHTPTRNLRACQCFNESEIPDPAADFKGRYIDNLPVMFDHRVYLYYNIYFKYHQSDGPFRYLKWEPCLLFDTMFRCPLVNIDGAPELFTTVFEIALPKNCYEANRMIHWEQLDTMTIFGAMGNFRQVASINQVTSKVLMSSRNSHSRFLNTLCTHQTTAFTYCPPFEAESLLDPNSYFNNVVDEDFQWIIFDIGSHKHISLLKLFINRMDLSAMRFLEVFVRGAPLPHWLVETDFRSSDGEKGRRTEYFRRATMAEKMLWWHCEDLKFHHGVSYIYSECCPHQRTRWVMIRMKVNSDLLEMKYMMGFDWLKFPEISRILVTNLQVFETSLDMMNCLTMHHPPMGPENADYWEDLYSFDGSGQPQEPPVFTQTHPQFTLPLTTHDSVHPDERFLQEDWDVEACGDWEIMKDTTIVGVPSKLKLTISEEHPRGQSCYEWKEALGPIKDSSCKRAVYFRVDNDTGEVIHYPDFGRSYGLAVDMQNCQFVCAVSRECKAFEFSQNSFCRLHFISYSLNTMYAYESGTVYGRKSDTMTTSNPFTWNNPYHPYYRMLQDLLEETGFFR
ncbi:hypothetical protein BOX15_Mlig000602g5 [Macrostomum lignano]|uniref:Kringle domain-containing protein n=1 Tax=Macrostomum lignano TaxID=282301 RepID=A0A267G4U9_9PLAT|nr:hypothetical protein BOX15_Mlig000602g5 [Macrostomum lignano]